MSQHLDALARANGVRLAVAAVKRDVAGRSREDGARRVADLLRDPDDAAGAVRIEELLLSIREVGPRIAGSVFVSAGIVPVARTRRARELTLRQREVIAQCIEDWADGLLAAGRTA